MHSYFNGRTMTLNQNFPLIQDINTSQVEANRHGYRKTVDLSEQLPNFALRFEDNYVTFATFYEYEYYNIYWFYSQK